MRPSRGQASKVSSPTLDLLAVIYVPTRILQSIQHVASGRPIVVQGRFMMFLIQLAALFGMIAVTAQALLAAA